MNFCSDNVSGVAVEITAALIAANHGAAIPYGNDELNDGEVIIKWGRKIKNKGNAVIAS